MNNNSKYIYLLSSNARKEYILDALETLALPFGWVQHYRYQLKYVDNELKQKIPKEKENKDNKLRDYKVIACYLYQEKKNEESGKWLVLYPFRLGTLVEVYKTGDRDIDIVHFYFKTEEYIFYNQENFTELLKQIFKDENKQNKFYAILGNKSDKLNIASKQNSKSAFHKICEFLKEEHFKSWDGTNEYYPLFCLIEGLKGDKPRKWWIGIPNPFIRQSVIFKPQYDKLSCKSYYKISEATSYSLGFEVYFPKRPPEFSIKIKSDEKVFAPPICEFKVASRYDEENCVLMTRLLERNICSFIAFNTECKDHNCKETLNLFIKFPVKIVRKIFYRIVEVVGDAGFAVGTGSIALSKILGEKWGWWYLPVIVGYALWIICKLVIKLLWRG